LTRPRQQPLKRLKKMDYVLMIVSCGKYRPGPGVPGRPEGPLGHRGRAADRLSQQQRRAPGAARPPGRRVARPGTAGGARTEQRYGVEPPQLRAQAPAPRQHAERRRPPLPGHVHPSEEDRSPTGDQLLGLSPGSATGPGSSRPPGGRAPGARRGDGGGARHGRARRRETRGARPTHQLPSGLTSPQATRVRAERDPQGFGAVTDLFRKTMCRSNLGELSPAPPPSALSALG